MSSTRRTTRGVITGAAAVTGVIAVICAIVGYQAYREGLDEFYTYGGYANALGEYLDEHGICPDSLDTLERNYNAKGRRRATIPPPPPRTRPLYLPPLNEATGEQLVLVSPEPAGRWKWFRVVIFADIERRQVRCEMFRASHAKALAQARRVTASGD